MIKDYDGATIELTTEEVEKFENDSTFREEVIGIAIDISDTTDLTCEIYGPDGIFVQSVNA